MMRQLISLVWPAILLVVAGVSPVLAQADLVIEKTDVSIAKNYPTNTTYVTVTVHNNASVVSGPFVLRVGVSVAGSVSTTDFVIFGLSPGQSTSKLAGFPGTNWMCGWGNADIGHLVTELSETNNIASENDYWIAIVPGTAHNETIGVANPGLDTETITLTPSAPPDWIATVTPDVMTLAPGELRDAVVRLGAPSYFDDYVRVPVYGTFEDGTPGVVDWEFHLESTIPVEETTWGTIKALFGE